MLILISIEENRKSYRKICNYFLNHWIIIIGLLWLCVDLHTGYLMFWKICPSLGACYSLGRVLPQQTHCSRLKILYAGLVRTASDTRLLSDACRLISLTMATRQTLVCLCCVQLFFKLYAKKIELIRIWIPLQPVTVRKSFGSSFYMPRSKKKSITVLCSYG